MAKRLFKYKNYDVHSITTVAGNPARYNANIVTWLTQTDMGGKVLAVALYKPDYTLGLVRESGLLNVNLLAIDQTKLIRKLGQQSGRETNKFKNLPHAFDERGCPFLTEAIGYAKCRVLQFVEAGDHDLCICVVMKQVVLNPDKDVLTLNLLREKKLIRG
jgi:flavin reductase (DIM6/NTAB) family NADH-FMN oxidoreductase RutF